ncbi:CheY-like chemotaxis protein [Caulobacter ginsengisoli]|uniref:histidine kinase n=1 Tax=Caulobacter ginsengisoli TaxID=400775 RepID=A0ABU0IYA0_9CAUL|nr:response regulator [Caulobacter ginsengisoli]MDQ0466988.1 CheY-like chemotaxis protein [Caulobacter ginsengisoli]
MKNDAQAITPEQLATLSHEFRTPLNGVLGMARLLDGTPLTAEQRSYVAALKESGDHLLSLVNDVLDLARLGAGRIELHAAPMSADNLLRQVCELMSPRAHEKGIEIAWAVAPGLTPVLADEGRLRQVLLNFVGNAVKFTETGGVLITAEPGQAGALRLTVSDSGPGVPEAARQRIFEAFVHADPIHGGAAVGGAGLGLAIVSRLGAAMNARMGVGGTPGEGADFWFEADFPPILEEGAGPAPVEQPLTGLTVGVASPSPVVREAAARQIAACGGTAITAATPAELAALTDPAAVLLIDQDCGDGKRPPAPPEGRTALVLLRPDQRDRIPRRRKAGFAGFLIKPLRSASLAERVLAALRPDAKGKQAAVQDDRIAEAAAPGVRVLLAEDNPINALLARALLEREGCHVERVASGLECLAALSATSYDLVLMDLRMPGLNGMEATRELRQRGVITPIVALTADAFEDDRRACLAAGMDDFLVKPLTHAALRAALARWTDSGTSAGWTRETTQAKLAS